jgi:hypothetical protein
LTLLLLELSRFTNKMKLSLFAGCALLSTTQVVGFQVAPLQQRVSLTSLSMFGGAGAGSPKEDNAEDMKSMEKTATAMGMSVDEYKVAMNARLKLAETLDGTMVTGGKAGTVLVERDVNNPPKKFEITITEAGKALGQEALSKELCAALKSASDSSKSGRQEAQQKMMAFITDQLK